MLGVLLRARVDLIAEYFEKNSVIDYVIAKCQKACAALIDLDKRANISLDDHPIWWKSWIKNGDASSAATSADIAAPEPCVYLAASINPETKPIQRKESVHAKWLQLTEAFQVTRAK